MARSPFESLIDEIQKEKTKEFTNLYSEQVQAFKKKHKREYKPRDYKLLSNQIVDEITDNGLGIYDPRISHGRTLLALALKLHSDINEILQENTGESVTAENAPEILYFLINNFHKEGNYNKTSILAKNFKEHLDSVCKKSEFRIQYANEYLAAERNRFLDALASEKKNTKRKLKIQDEFKFSNLEHAQHMHYSETYSDVRVILTSMLVILENFQPPQGPDSIKYEAVAEKVAQHWLNKNVEKNNQGSLEDSGSKKSTSRTPTPDSSKNGKNSDLDIYESDAPDSKPSSPSSSLNATPPPSPTKIKKPPTDAKQVDKAASEISLNGLMPNLSVSRFTRFWWWVAGKLKPNPISNKPISDRSKNEKKVSHKAGGNTVIVHENKNHEYKERKVKQDSKALSGRRKVMAQTASGGVMRVFKNTEAGSYAPVKSKSSTPFVMHKATFWERVTGVFSSSKLTKEERILGAESHESKFSHPASPRALDVKNKGLKSENGSPAFTPTFNYSSATPTKNGNSGSSRESKGIHNEHKNEHDEGQEAIFIND